MDVLENKCIGNYSVKQPCHFGIHAGKSELDILKLKCVSYCHPERD